VNNSQERRLGYEASGNLFFFLFCNGQIIGTEKCVSFQFYINPVALNKYKTDPW